MKTLVLGGTGSVGSQVVAGLLAGHPMRSFDAFAEEMAKSWK